MGTNVVKYRLSVIKRRKIIRRLKQLMGEIRAGTGALSDIARLVKRCFDWVKNPGFRMSQ